MHFHDHEFDVGLDVDQVDGAFVIARESNR